MKKYTSLLFVSGIILFSLFLGCEKDNEDADENKQGNNLNVGVSANSFLSDDYYDRLTVEVLYMSDYEPTENAVNNLLSFLNNYLNKPDEIEIIVEQIPAQGKNSYSVDDLTDIESEYRTRYNTNTNIAASLIVLDGEYSENNQVLGVAYRNTSMAIFGSTIAENSGGISQPSRSKLESAIMNHEFGHLLGLVDLGTEMVDNHEDPDHGKHCDNSDCLMYYAVETTEIASFLMESDVPDLDQNCKNDLILNGGKQ